MPAWLARLAAARSAMSQCAVDSSNLPVGLDDEAEEVNGAERCHQGHVDRVATSSDEHAPTRGWLMRASKVYQRPDR